ncbi:tetratricopeptide repeat-containing sulfotransferase family protein [Pararhodospirillum oryzae]|uniref:Sulfotransferase n=1 Tax=Pararhodospirillum oryzae TaxID=478448 RepID=A0A512HBJ6_9PROT|nr:tetratricopeptide repeat-containing sulfotransferase family protein [Pararhodospirillum oryzae]GEO82824.1 sulfotransferase [Pararhodospirillum oryzae]
MPRAPRPVAPSPARVAGTARLVPLLETARRLQAAGHWREAEAAWRQVLAQDDRVPEALAALAGLALRAGQPGAALSLAERAATLAPEDTQALLAFGHALLETGRPGPAAQVLDRVLGRKPRLPEALLLRGLAAGRQGQRDPAIDWFRKALRARKDYPEAHLNLGTCLAQAGQTDEALRHFNRAVALDPRAPLAHLNLAQALLDAGFPARAREHAAKARALGGDPLAALLMQARALEAEDNFPATLATWRALLALAPAHPGLLNDAATFLLNDNRLDEAVAWQRRAVALRPAEAVLRRNLITGLMSAGAVAEAEERMKAWVAASPGAPLAWRLLGDVRVRAGRFEAARTALGRAWTLDPADDSHAVALTTTGRLGPENPWGDRIAARAGAAQAAGTLGVDLAYAAGKVWDDRKEYDRAFAAYRVANTVRGAEAPFDAEAHDAEISALIDTFTPALFQDLAGLGSSSEVPVLVVGLPRSGTTLAEQIIASHPQAAGAGELTHFSRLEAVLPWLVGNGPGADPYPGCARALTPAALDPFIAQYLAALERVGGARARRVVDKLPNNFLRLGLFALAFPRGRVVHCRRDLADTCLSLYFQNFMGGHAFRHDLATLGRYARAHERVMAHWRQVLPVPMLDLDYARLVADPETEARALLAFLDLSWDPAVLAFHQRRQQPVATASRWQVRQPITTRSVARWRAYAAHLGPLLRELGEPWSTEVAQ